jgi:Ala-tRNA(Pro) deacylase
MKTPQQLLEYLDNLNIKTQTHHHAAFFTVEESKAAKVTIKGAHSKNLFVKDKKGKIFALITLAEAVINLKTIHEKIGASGRVSFGSEQQLFDLWGVRPGSVTPFGAINDVDLQVTVILDAALMAHEILNFHPLINTMTTSIDKSDLIKFLQATDHNPQIIYISEEV